MDFLLRTLLLLASVGLSGQLNAAEHIIYLDSANPQAGNGSEANPFNRLSLINWTTVSNQLAAGNTVAIQLKRRSVFHELLTVRAVGSANAPLVIRPYGDDGSAPIIRGDTMLSGWTPHSTGVGQTWSVPLSGNITFAWIGDTLLRRGTNSDSLKDNEWVAASNRLYLRNDAGNPDEQGLKVSASTRVNALLITGSSFVNVEDVQFQNSAAHVARIDNSAAINFRRCQFLRGGGHVTINSLTNGTFVSCLLEDSYGAQAVNVAGPTTTVSLYFCQIYNSEGTAVQITGCNRFRAANCNFIGTRLRGIENSSTGVVEIANCLVSGVAHRAAVGGEAITSSTGVCQVANSLVLPNGQTALHMKGVTDLGGNVYSDPRFERTRHEGIWISIEDDYPNLPDWAVLARLARSNFNFRTTLALNSTQSIHPDYVALVQNLINEGHDIVSHTRSHANITVTQVFNIRYTGVGATCLLSISNNVLTTTVPDVPSDNLSIDLTAANVDKVEEIIPYIDGLNQYNCAYISSQAAYNHSVPSRLLDEISNVDIKSDFYRVALDPETFYTNELRLPILDLATTFKDPFGNPYNCKYIVYPGGYENTASIAACRDAGYLGGRLDSPSGGAWRMDSFDLYRVQVATAALNGYMAGLFFERSTGDASLRQNTFSSSNLTYSSRAYNRFWSAQFNGSGSFLFRTNNSDFDFSKGDWHLSTHLWPDRVSGNQTLFHMSSGAGNFFKVYCDAQGALRLLLVADGVEKLALATPVASIRTNGWQKICVQQIFDRWIVRINENTVLQATNSARLPAYTNDVLIGCALDQSGAHADYYSGLMDNLYMSNGTYYRTQAAADVLCEAGALTTVMSHGEAGVPREIWRIMLQALSEYSGRLRVMTFTDALDFVRTNGVLQPDGRTVVRNLGRGIPDYNLRYDSPCITAGANAVIEGIPNLIDGNGVAVTDAMGSIVVGGGKLSIGALQPRLHISSLELAAGTTGQSYSNKLSAIGGVGPYRWALVTAQTLPPGLVLSEDGTIAGEATQAGSFSFLVEVRDAQGHVATQAISLSIAPSSGLTQLQALGFRTNNLFRLAVRTNRRDQVVLIESSTNLVHWDLAGSAPVSDGEGVWDDEANTNGTPRFYRARF